MSELKRYWVSWSLDTKPEAEPPGEAIAGCWQSSWAVVDAASEEEAKVAVEKEWPAAKKGWRHLEEKPLDWTPNESLFPVTHAWMIVRLVRHDNRTHTVTLTSEQLGDLMSAVYLADDEDRSAGRYSQLIKLLEDADKDQS